MEQLKLGMVQPMTRREDVRFLAGKGRSVADSVADDSLLAAFLRSDRPHEEIASLDRSDARNITHLISFDINSLGPAVRFESEDPKVHPEARRRLAVDPASLRPKDVLRGFPYVTPEAEMIDASGFADLWEAVCLRSAIFGDQITVTTMVAGLVAFPAGVRRQEDLPDHSEKMVADGQSFANGAHQREGEDDPETAALTLDRHSTADDFGVLGAPDLVEGQAHDGIAQGFGRTVTGGLSDHAMPRALDLPFTPNRIWTWMEGAYLGAS